MFVHDASLVFPKLTQVNSTAGRVYRIDGTDHVFPSITRVLGSKPKPQLEAWKKRVGAKEAGLVSARATVQGTKVHGLAENYLANRELPTEMPHIMELWTRLRPWLDAHISRVYAQEQDTCSFKLGVAGRLDLLADADDEIAVVDIKTAKAPKKEEYVVDYYLQGTFYALAVYELTKRVIKRIVVPVVSPDALQIFETTPAAHFSALVERVQTFYESFTIDTAAVPVV